MILLKFYPCSLDPLLGSVLELHTWGCKFSSQWPTTLPVVYRKCMSHKHGTEIYLSVMYSRFPSNLEGNLTWAGTKLNSKTVALLLYISWEFQEHIVITVLCYIVYTWANMLVYLYCTGMWKGLTPRIIMIGTLTALQWFIYDSVKVFFRLPRPPPPEMPASLKAKLGVE